MNVPGIVQSTLDGEEIAARVSLGGEDELFITPSRTLVYRSEGLLSDESVNEYSHDADRLTLSEGRRKTKFTLEYALEGTQEFSVPSSKTDDALHPVIAGILNGNEITEPGETVVQTYRFSELTLLITSDRLVKHIGGAVWDEDYEEYAFEDVTNLSFEDGSVATQIVLSVDGRPQRIKAPNDEANDLRERLQRALFEYHDVESLAELNETVGEDDSDDDTGTSDASMDFGDGVDPLDANPPELTDHDDGERERDPSRSQTQQDHSADPLGQQADARSAESQSGRAETQSQPQSHAQSSASDSAHTATVSEQSSGAAPETDSGIVDTDSIFDETDEAAGENEFSSAAGSGAGGGSGAGATQGAATSDTPSAGTDPEVLDRLDTLEAALEEQNELIEQQQQTIEQLITELRQGR
ncbi:DUF7115 domain-containing protein [Natrialba asiatica]|uniref:DUF7115 domain-containing protein n=1 Tax=Natrialba asiatica (strain ATCC 700177 / DSM 12278 / JCM 9576 / FERM P-10747 / NBRC 102637 / 172P1) TaxID=29540 RepID=M0AT08_NATA1|nr:hypothetical protein [Natrialba asiatica]ELZ01851.1 hypothetical protein C481_10032 [Natrialba asiatica DSM 12278]